MRVSARRSSSDRASARHDGERLRPVPPTLGGSSRSPKVPRGASFVDSLGKKHGRGLRCRMRYTETASRFSAPAGFAEMTTASPEPRCRQRVPASRATFRTSSHFGANRADVGDDNGKRVKDRSDAERLLTRGMLRRVTALRGAAPSLSGSERDLSGSRSESREGLGRETQRTLSGSGCNTLEPSVRRKPSRRWKSARTERYVHRVEPARRRKVATPTGSGRTGDRTGGREPTRVKPKRGGSGDRSRTRAGAPKVAPSPRRTRQVYNAHTGGGSDAEQTSRT